MIPRIVFSLLLLMLALVAVPFGANREWAWGLLAALIGAMLLPMAAAFILKPGAQTVAWQHYRWLAAGYLLVLAWMIVQAMPGLPEFLHHPVWQQASAALGRTLPGTIAVNPAAAAAETAKFAAYGGIFWLALQFGGHDTRARVMLWVILLAVAANALYGLAVYFSGNNTILWFPKWAFPEFLSGTFVNRNHFATYAALGLLIGFGFLVEELRRISAGMSLRSIAGLLRAVDALDFRLYGLLLIVGTIALAMIFTASRGAMIATAGGIIGFLVCASRSSRVSGVRILRFGAALALVGLVALSVSGDKLAARLESIAFHSSSRLNVFEATIQLIFQRPILGIGGGGFEGMFHSIRPEPMNAEYAIYAHAHNTYLEFGLEHGLPALFIMLILSALLLAAFLRGAARRKRNDLIPAIGAGALVTVAMHAFVDFSLEIPAVAATYAAIAGVCFAQSFPHRSRGHAGEIPASPEEIRAPGS
jgi:O-antigen ligase